jgi:hypothetical protein
MVNSIGTDGDLAVVAWFGFVIVAVVDRFGYLMVVLILFGGCASFFGLLFWWWFWFYLMLMVFWFGLVWFDDDVVGACECRDIALKLYHDGFLPNISQFIHLPPFH